MSTVKAVQAREIVFCPNGARQVSLGQVNPRMRMNAAPVIGPIQKSQRFSLIKLPCRTIGGGWLKRFFKPVKGHDQQLEQ